MIEFFLSYKSFKLFKFVPLALVTLGQWIEIMIVNNNKNEPNKTLKGKILIKVIILFDNCSYLLLLSSIRPIIDNWHP